MKFIIGYKKGMTQIFDDKGNTIPSTVIDVREVVYLGEKEEKKDGYNSISIGIGKKRKPSKAEKGKYKKLKYVPKKVVEFRVDDLKEYEKYNIGDKFDVGGLKKGDKVKVTGITKGKGFQGVVKRWRFKGGKRTHGQSDRERAPGSIGGGTDPGRVFKGKKMPGHMGNKVKTVLNLEVVKVGEKEDYICLKGGVPGSKNSLIKIVKKDK